MQPLVIYHGQCRDGFCAAWCVWRRFGRADFHAGVFGHAPPDVAGRDVVMVDFSYPRQVLEEIADKAESLLILDHHKTAEAALQGFSRPNAEVHFDMKRSGAGMAWDHYWTGPRPWLVNYVEDRDLWLHKLPDGAAVNAYISTLPFDFETWYKASGTNLGDAAKLGRVVEDKIRQYVTEVSKNSRRVEFEGHNIPVVNCAQVDVSEVGSFLSQGEPMAVCWWQAADGRFVYSLRSREPSQVDVSEIAKKYGGGGHTRAAGFQLKEFLF